VRRGIAAQSCQLFTTAFECFFHKKQTYQVFPSRSDYANLKRPMAYQPVLHQRISGPLPRRTPSIGGAFVVDLLKHTLKHVPQFVSTIVYQSVYKFLDDLFSSGGGEGRGGAKGGGGRGGRRGEGGGGRGGRGPGIRVSATTYKYIFVCIHALVIRPPCGRTTTLPQPQPQPQPLWMGSGGEGVRTYVGEFFML
jgi:hypothetical protein